MPPSPANTRSAAGDFSGCGGLAIRLQHFLNATLGGLERTVLESYVAGRLGLGAAVDYALRLGLPAIRDRVVALAERLRARLDELPGVAVRDLGEQRCGIVTFTKAGEDAAAVKARLRAQAIHVSVSTAAGTLLDFEARGIPDLVRASVHYYNDEAEIDRLVAALAAA